MIKPLLTVKNLQVRYPKRSIFSAMPPPALSEASFSLENGKILGVVGESGSGKTTLIRALLRLIPSANGQIQFDGNDWLALKGKSLIKARQNIGVVSQNPFLSLSPRMAISQILAEPVQATGKAYPSDEVLSAALKSVGLSAAFMPRQASELSGGQAQRVAIARALMLSPKLLILDEATSALDVSVQAQVLNLLMEIRANTQLAMIFVSHDLDVVKHISDQLLVMTNGKIVEQGDTERIIASPQHGYTQSLLAAK